MPGVKVVLENESRDHHSISRSHLMERGRRRKRKRKRIRRGTKRKEGLGEKGTEIFIPILDLGQQMDGMEKENDKKV